MNYSVRLFLGLLIGLSLAGGVFWWQNQEGKVAEPISTSQNTSTENELTEVPVLTNTEIALYDQALKFTIDVHEPIVLLLRNPLYAKEANDVIGGFVDTIIREFKESVSEATLSSRSDEFGDSNYTSDLTMRYTPLLLSPTIISIRFDVSEYYAGAAHPNNYARVLNYHFKKHQVLSTALLFASSSQALPFLSAYTRSALQRTFSDLSGEEFALQAFPGTEVNPENWEAVGVTKNGLSVIFNPYQVAPYARGISEVKIPLHDLDSIVSHEVMEAIRMAGENILEAQPLEPTSK
jgi:hypothetical protein